MKKKPPKEYPPEFGEAYQTLGIVLGAPDFEGKMGLLKEMIANPLPLDMKLAVIALNGATLREQEAWEYLLTYYENQKPEKR
ncbi:hypothetical protein Q4E40_02750 [Pontibacter sp. BT731]|uniref:hypothetical protein n=1 Tax=Pontibacter coccineus TaxID=3063328 RepID=UPI0026E38192|nr:hypothetical protein [Pontibacter sp. BT731]MDO6389032.1 hypothetical protein [Pontibacter sp. BT731]